MSFIRAMFKSFECFQYFSSFYIFYELDIISFFVIVQETLRTLSLIVLLLASKDKIFFVFSI